VCFSTVFAFFPLYARKAELSLVLIGSILGVRTLISTTVRVPVGILAQKMNSTVLVFFAIVLSSVALFAIPIFDSYYPLLIVLSLEGMSYGIILVSSSTLIVQVSQRHERGAAMGLLTTSQCADDTIGSLALGLIGEWWSLRTVFAVASATAVLGAIYLGVHKDLFAISRVD